MLSAIFKGIGQRWKKRFHRWLDRRSPPSDVHRLNRRNLYIFPTKLGFAFLLLVFVLWLLGTNYQNNLILALAFLLVSIFVVSILHTFSNLAGLEFTFKGVAPVFSGEIAQFTFDVKNPNSQACDHICASWQQNRERIEIFALEANSSSPIFVPIDAPRRGVLLPGRLLLESVFPLGLFRCWTWLNWNAQGLVYPEPLKVDLLPSFVLEDEAGEGDHPVRGGEDFNALNDYRPGDSPRHISWKTYARGKGLFTKEFSQNISREIWLDFSSMTSNDGELQLSGLCYWALQFHQQDENYGLLL
ncbi:MAG: hypothetical protein ACI9Y1_003114, partial [Lentisphaeria bacterium]